MVIAWLNVLSIAPMCGTPYLCVQPSATCQGLGTVLPIFVLNLYFGLLLWLRLHIGVWTGEMGNAKSHAQ